jgi:hypothetical protein
VAAAKHLHLTVGSVLRLGAVAGNGPSPSNPIRRLTERVAGVVVTQTNVVPTTDSDQFGNIYASPELLYGLGPNWRNYQAFDGTYVRLRPGTSTEAFTRSVQQLAGRYPSTQDMVYVTNEEQQAANVEHAIRPEAIALALFGLISALTMLLIVGQLAARQLSAATSSYATLGALGMTRSQLVLAGIIEVGLVAVAGSLLAAGLAIVASPLMPIGPSRIAELHPGISVDWVVLGFGMLAVVLVITGLVIWPAWRMTARGSHLRPDAGVEAHRPGPLARLLGGSGIPPVTSIGIRGVFERGQGASSLPVRSGILGTAVSLATVAATLTFGANFLHLVSTPRLYGQTWDSAVDVQFGQLPSGVQHQMAHRPGLTALTFGVHGTIAIRGSVIPAVGLTRAVGPLLTPDIVEGKAPETDHEMALGSSSLRQLGLVVGDRVSATINGKKSLMHIVGRAVFPHFGQGSFAATDLGQGALVTAAVLAAPAGGAHEIALMRFASGGQHDHDLEATSASLQSFCQNIDQSTCLLTSQRPSDIDDLARVEGAPVVLASVLALSGIAVLAQLVLLFCRRWRRNMAILKTLGMLRRQVLAITCWQTSTLAATSLLIGLPVGAAAGRWIWGIFADNVGVVPDAVIPTWKVLLIVPVLVIIANVIALVPGWRNARRSPARVLQGE